MGLRPFRRLGFELVEVCIELGSVDSPNATAPELDRWELAGADQGVDLGNARAEVCRYILELEIARG